MPDPLRPTERFSRSVDDYARFRPSYPAALVHFLEKEAELAPGDTIVDLGSGTGIFSRLLLERGHAVTGVEPNAAMRATAEEALKRYRNFRSVAGSAEETGLPDACAALVVAAQAFHWFDVWAARREVARILAPGAPAVVVWNMRRSRDTAFLEGYEALLRKWGTDYVDVLARHERREDLEAFFERFEVRSFPNSQVLDGPGLRGRLLSSSYVPGPGCAARERMLEELARLFEAHEHEGVVRMEYDTRIYWGRPRRPGEPRVPRPDQERPRP